MDGNEPPVEHDHVVLVEISGEEVLEDIANEQSVNEKVEPREIAVDLLPGEADRDDADRDEDQECHEQVPDGVSRRERMDDVH